MFCYMATAPAPVDADGKFIQPEGARFHKRGEVEPPPVGDPMGFMMRMARERLEVRFYDDDRGDVIDRDGNTIHRHVLRRPGRADEIEE